MILHSQLKHYKSNNLSLNEVHNSSLNFQSFLDNSVLLDSLLVPHSISLCFLKEINLLLKWVYKESLYFLSKAKSPKIFPALFISSDIPNMVLAELEKIK